MTSKGKAGRLLVSLCTFGGRFIWWASPLASFLRVRFLILFYEGGVNKMADAGHV